MFEPSVTPSAPPPPPRLPEPAPHQGRALALLGEVREAQARALWTQGVLWAVSAFLALLVAGAWLGPVAPRAAQALVVAGAALAFALLLLFGVWLPRRRVGDEARTARLLAAQLPELNLDLLAAVELSRALGTREDFSPALARAFLRDVDARAARHSVATLLDGRPVRRAALGLLATVAAVLAVTLLEGPRVRAGLAAAFARRPAAEPLRRTPITGDVELSYRYPLHTGLAPRTVTGSTGEVRAPAGTEVALTTRADREVEAAALVVNGQRLALRVQGRELSGRFVLDASGQYSVAFLDDGEVVAEGPDQPITVEVDQPPQARLTAPVDGLELDPEKQQVTVRYEATDDYGLSALALVYAAPGAEPKRLPLRPDDGRATRGQIQWDLGPLGLQPGQVVSYHLEATDNDAVKGPKPGVSATLTLKLYSADEHRREALAKAEALWERLVAHLADRLEAKDRQGPTTPDAALAGRPVDERAGTLAADFGALAEALGELRDPPEELLGALLNIGRELSRDLAAVTAQRRLLLRLAGREGGAPGKVGLAEPKAGPMRADVGHRLAAALATDAADAEKNVLYLEALLDRAKLEAIKALARQLKDDRRELSRLVEEFARTGDDAVQRQLLEQMEALKQRMLELQQRMMELSKGIRDDFMNAEALQQMQEEFGMESALAQVEQLVKAGNAEEALKKMQELAMQMDDFLENLDEAGARAETETDPELARQFEAFQDNLAETAKQQEALADKTRALRDKYRAQQRERLARQGEALKRELAQRLAELEKGWKALDPERFGFRFEEARRAALSARDNVAQALEADDFDLASESADRMEALGEQLVEQAAEQRRLDELFQNPPEVRRESKQAHDALARDQRRAAEVAQKLRDLFPPPGQQMSEADRQQAGELSRQQRQLQQRAQQLERQMEAIGERAPLFDEQAQEQVQQAAQRMQGAGERLQGKDPSRAHGEQQGALQALQGLQQALEQAGNAGGKKGGIPLPLKGRGRGHGRKDEKVELPQEDPNAPPGDLRKDVLDAMKQGAPDRYREQTRRYYEELVK